MKNSAIFIAVLFAIYITQWLRSILSDDIKAQEYVFLSRTHQTIYNGVAALIIMLQHVGGSFGTRAFTPLGGTGVAMFLIASGYGLNESYKKKQIAISNKAPEKIRGGVLET